MDWKKRTEITIREPAGEISLPDPAGRYSAKTLNTIPESRSSNACHPYEIDPPASRSNVERTANRTPNSGTPLDVDLLLRCYAHNSSMEKSINKVFEISDEKYSNRTSGSLADQINQNARQEPLVELGAACKICESLKETASKNDLLATFRVHDILTKLKSLVHRCSNRTLDQLLTADPSLSRCPHCGVIRRSEKVPRDNSVESRTSNPKMSYFLSAQMFPDIDISGIDDDRPYEGVTRLYPRKEQSSARMDKYRSAQKHYSRSPHRLNKDRDKSCDSRVSNTKVDREFGFGSNGARGIESMEAERENPNETMADENKVQLRYIEKNSNRLSGKSADQAGSKHSTPRQMSVSSRVKDRADPRNDSTVSSRSRKIEKYYDDVNYKAKARENASRIKRNRWGCVTKRQLAEECNEKVMKDILYVASKSPLDDFEPHTCVSLNSRQSLELRHDRSTSVFKEPLPTGAATHLSNRRCGESIDNGRDGPVARLEERVRHLQSRHLDDRHSFAVSDSLQRKRGLNSEFWVPDKLIRSMNAIEGRGDNLRVPKRSQDHSKQYVLKNRVKRYPHDSSTTCSMENDSLENEGNMREYGRSLKYPRESSATVFSSSSAENMIREWVNHPRTSEDSTADETCEKLNALKPSIAQLNIEPETARTDGAITYRVQTSSVNQRDSEVHGATKSKTSKSKVSQEKLQRWSKHNDDISRASKDRKSSDDETRSARSKKDGGSERKKRFGQQLLDSFRRVTSSKSVVKTKDHGSSAKSINSGNCSGNPFKNIARRIVYNEASLRGIVDANGRSNRVEDILLLYRRVLESTKQMDWQSFQRFVEDLHPNQKQLWRDICNAVDNEVKRMDSENDGRMEISIEITSIPFEAPRREESSSSNEIMFEMDITLGDIEKCFARQLPSVGRVQLDTLKGADEVIKV